MFNVSFIIHTLVRVCQKETTISLAKLKIVGPAWEGKLRQINDGKLGPNMFYYQTLGSRYKFYRWFGV